jgi:putative cardiolipin synthase
MPARYLLHAGVELHQIDKILSKQQRKEKKGSTGSSRASLHAKSFVIDRERVFIDSMNLGPCPTAENEALSPRIRKPGRACSRHVLTAVTVMHGAEN